jgi:diguanylate cyclase (GGDEF)-like protein
VPAPAIAVVLVALLVGNVLLIWAILGRRRIEGLAPDGIAAVAAEPVDLAIELAGDPEGGPASASGIRPATYDRVVRIVSYTFFAITAVVVAGGGLWPDSAPAIYLLLLVGAVVIYLLHDREPRLPDADLFVVEGAAAVTFFTVLIMLTGDITSPYFFGYFLIVVAAALVTGGGASLVLAAAITAAFLGALLMTRGGQPYTAEQIAIGAIDVLALWLLSYLASVVAGEQRKTRDTALRLSLHDPLTRLYNRTFLFAVIEREIARAGRTNRRFSLLMLDLDGLKPVNDRYGHYFGDRMLQAVAEAVKQGIRVIDTAARYGGDEFVVLLPETDTEGAAVVAEKLRRSVAAIRLNAGTELLSSTASIGVVAFPDDGRTADALTNRADQVMYVAKRAGRNRVSIEGREAAEPPAVPVTSTTSAPRRPRNGSTPIAPAGPARARTVRTAPAKRAARRAVTHKTRRIEHRAMRQEPRPSMFADHYPTITPWTRARPAPWVWSPGTSAGTATAGREGGDAGGPSDGPTAAAGSSAGTRSLTTLRVPTTRIKRFLVEHPDDPTFDRTMDHFLGGDEDAATGFGPRASGD